MMKKRSLRLALLAAVFIFLHSCVHDDLISSSDQALIYSKEYHSKSLWKEDETYIKNVMKVYNENEAQIKKVNGIPLWDYAMTMGYTDESFLVVPIANGKKIVACIEVPRYGDQITFVYDNNKEHLKFFQGYTTAKKRKPVQQTREQSSMTGRLKLCSVTAVEMWYPDNENEPNGSGHWEVTGYITKCDEMQGGDESSNPNPEGPTYPYPGGGGGTQSQPQTPCEKTKSIVNNVKSKPAIDSLKKKSTGGGEDGYKIKADGTPSDIIHGGAHSVKLGDKTGYQGGYHNHTPSGIPMFSPPDIEQLLQFALAQGNYGTPSNAFMGMIAPNGMHYVMTFNGNYNDALVTFSQANVDAFTSWYRRHEAELTDLELNGTTYINADGKINTDGVEKLLFDTLKKMGLEGKVSLQRIEGENIVKKITLNSDGQKTTATPCP